MTKKIRLFTYLLAMLLACCMSITAVKVFANEQAPLADGSSVKVSFYLNKGDEDFYKQQTVAFGDYVEIPETPSMADYVFIRWDNLSTNEKFAFNSPVADTASDINLVAVWEKVVFAVTFKVGDNIVSQQKVAKNTDAVAPANVEEFLPSGQTFLGWDASYSKVTQDLVINANLGVKTYSIPVIGVGGVKLNTLEIAYGDTVKLSDITSDIDHYTCTGFEWITDVISQPLTSLTVNSEGVLRLVFTPVDYTATFKVEGKTDEVIAVKAFSQVPYPATPVKENCIFIGWYNLADNELFEFQTELTGNVVLEAKFISIEKTKFDVVFYDGYGNQYGGIQRVEEGSSAIEPGSPYMEGYEFIAWDKDFSNVTENISIYPIYKVNSYTVQFVGEDGEVLKTVSNVRYGENVLETDVPNPKDIEGKEFICWDNSYKNIKQDTVITAVYKIKTYSVMFYDENMNKIGVAQNVKHGESAIIPSVNKTGYIFKGWKSGVNSEDTPYCIKDVSVFFAEYQIIQYKITFIFNDGITENAVITVDYGKTVGVMSPSNRVDYTFNGWFTDDTTFANAFNFNTIINKDLTLYASWEQNPPTVTYKIDGAIYLEQAIEYGSKAIQPTVPARYGYDFICWLIEGTDTEYNFDSIVTDEVVLVAKFVPKTYKVTFYFGDGQSQLVSVEHGKKVSELDLPDDTDKIGYQFIGWNIKDILDREIYGDVSVFAEYSINNYSIEYIVDGNVVVITTAPYNGYAHMVSAPNKLGYTFAYWTVEGEDTAFDFANTKITSELKLVAYYQKNTYIVYYFVNGILFDAVQLQQGEEIDLSRVPNYDSTTQRFLGWDTNATIVNGSDVIVRGEIYTLQNFNIYYYINGEIYKTVAYMEDSSISILDAPTDEELNSENVGFVNSFLEWSIQGYDQLPATMPANDIFVNAILSTRYYYTLYYYVNNVCVAEKTMLEGDKIVSLELSEFSDKLDKNVVFDSWKYLPEVMPNTNFRVDANFEILHEYGVYYYINGSLFHSVMVMETEEIPDAKIPTDAELSNYLAENEEFNGWAVPVGFETMPTKMPNQNLTINANLTYKEYYVLSYYIDGVLYRSITLLEGAEVQNMEAPVIEDETISFVGWINEPEFMPSEDTIVNADFRRLNYYSVKYYINNELFHSERVLEGNEIPLAPSVEQGELPENVQFNGWQATDITVMPSSDVEIHADVIVFNYYTITYMLGDTVYNSITYMDGERVEKMEAPSNLPETIIFNAWLNEPDVMPDKDVVIFADFRELNYYYITYYINDEVFTTFRILEGSEIIEAPTPTPTSVPEGYEFVGWEVIEYTVMPAHDISVNAILNQLVKITNNVVFKAQNNADGSLTVSVEIKGDVNFAGLNGSITFNSFCQELEVSTTDNAGYAFMAEGTDTVKFVWSNGYNTTNDTLLMEFTVIPKRAGLTFGIADYSVLSIYAFSETGEIVAVQFTPELKIK